MKWESDSIFAVAPKHIHPFKDHLGFNIIGYSDCPSFKNLDSLSTSILLINVETHFI